MKKDSKDTLQLILKAAEEEFLEKGFAGAKTTSIAEKAGVTRAMLHYYFRTKENLFQKVFDDKTHVILSAFNHVLRDEDVDFTDKIRTLIETHFDFISQNPRLFLFVYNEIMNNEENKNRVLRILVPKFKQVLAMLEDIVSKEFKKGTVKDINIVFLFMNIFSLNLITFVALPIMDVMHQKKDEAMLKSFLEMRKESNIQFILDAIRK